jgi:hypothetical protein
MELRDYQKELSQQGGLILNRLKILYLAMEVRTGKTITALEVAKLVGAKNVIFLTKKKAIESVKADHRAMQYGFNLYCTNDENLHKVDASMIDLVIHDEHHRFGAFPKPGATTKLYKKLFAHLPQIFLSGTPTPESYSQIYHQFWVSNYSPFRLYPTFYKWAKEFVNVTQQVINSFTINNYTNSKIDQIEPLIEPYFLRYTQEKAKFKGKIIEHFLECPMLASTDKVYNMLKRDRVVNSSTGRSIVADTPAKLLQKLHQIGAGTIKIDKENLILDYSRGYLIAEKFKGKKIAIFYNFIGELAVLKKCFGDQLTTDINEFNTTDKCIALQIVSGREGISLAKAEALIFYNISFSAVSYWQARDRLTTQDRTENHIYFIFNPRGLDRQIFEAVKEKKNFTLRHFKDI